MSWCRGLGRAGRVAALLFAVVLAGATVAGSTASAQDDPGPSSGDLAAQFGGFDTTARAAGISFSYDSPGLIPGTPSPLLQASLPEASSNFSNGPSGYALASVLYPGALLSDLGPVVAEAGYDVPLPGYPIRTQAYYPAGPTSATERVGEAGMTSTTTATGSSSLATHGALAVPGLIGVGAITSRTSTSVEQGQVVSRARVELSNVNLVGGLIHIDSLVTDVVSTSNGTKAATAGTTRVGGMNLLGLPATIDANGVHLVAGQADPTPSPSTTSPLAGLTGAIDLDKLGLGKLGASLQPTVDKLNQLLTSTVATTKGNLDKLLAMGGIDIKLAQPTETIEGAQSERLADALQITLHYDGHTTPLMSQLLALIPSDKLPGNAIPGVPLNTSPQALVEILKATHVFTIGVGVGDVTAVATPAFELGPTSDTPGSTEGDTLPDADLGNGDIGAPVADTGGGSDFTTPTPELPQAETSPLAPTELVSFASTPMAVAASLLLLLLIGLAAWAASTRLADHTLAAASRACPDGLEDPPPGGGT